MDAAFWQQGETVDVFIADLGDNRARFEELLQQCTLSAGQQQRLEQFPEGTRVMVIAEPWSGDVLYNLPVLICMARAAGWDVRIFRRDKYPDLILPYRKEGLYHAIPVFVFYDEAFDELGHWIERPASATKTIDEESLALRRRLRAEHVDAWRQDTISELLHLAPHAEA